MIALLPQRKSIIAWTGLLLAGAVGWGLLRFGWSEEGVRFVVRSSAKVGVALFSAAFAASSLHALLRTNGSAWLVRNRRYLGLSFALSHGVHLLGLIALAVAFPARFLAQTDPFVLIGGGIGYAFVLAMALTSSDTAVRSLGVRRWRLLHTVGSYVIWAIFALSYFPLALASAAYVPFAALLFLSMGLRVATRAWSARASRPSLGRAA